MFNLAKTTRAYPFPIISGLPHPKSLSLRRGTFFHPDGMEALEDFVEVETTDVSSEEFPYLPSHLIPFPNFNTSSFPPFNHSTFLSINNDRLEAAVKLCNVRVDITWGGWWADGLMDAWAHGCMGTGGCVQVLMCSGVRVSWE